MRAASRVILLFVWRADRIAMEQPQPYHTERQRFVNGAPSKGWDLLTQVSAFCDFHV
jgi:hypothetical protein